VTVGDGAFAPTLRRPQVAPYDVYESPPTTAFGFGDETSGATRSRF
jgi:hypothetical protein